MKNLFLLSCCIFIATFSIECKAIDINPYPRQLIKKELVKKFDFKKIPKDGKIKITVLLKLQTVILPLK